MNQTTNEKRKSIALEVLGAMALYVPLLMATVLLLARLQGTVWQYPVVLLPVVPVVLLVRGLAGNLRELDELQQRIQLEAFGFALGATLIVSFTLGMLEFAGFPRLNWINVAPLMAALWGIGLFFASRRYR